MMVLHGELFDMKIPSNLTEKETLDKINLVISKISPKYTFSGYDIDDIKQEAFIICMDALERYDEQRPLENFLSVHLSNRLKNFIRDNFYVKNDEEKKKVLMPVPITHDQVVYDIIDSPDLTIMLEELKDTIDSKIPASMRMDYLKILNNVYVPKSRKEEILSFIKDLLNEEG